MRFFNISLICVICLLICEICVSQITFQKTYGGSLSEAAYSIIQTSDSGYVMTGYTYSMGSGSQDVYLLKTNKWGEFEWSKTYGGANTDVGHSLQQTTDGGFIIAGYTGSFGAGFNDVYLIKTDSIGNLQWSETFGGASTDRGYSVMQVNDGGYIVAGGTYSYGAGSSDIYLTKTDSGGNLEWSKTYGGQFYEEAYSIRETTDGGFILIGLTGSFGAGSEDIYVLKINMNGDIQWSKTYGGSAWDRGQDINQTSDGGYIICGFTQSFKMQKHYDLKCYLLKIDSIGNPEWSQTFGILNSENVAYSVVQTNDGGYCVAGYSGLFVGAYRTYLVKTDSSGNLQWSKTIGSGFLNSAYAVKQTSDGGFVIAAYTNGFGSGNTDIHLIKTTPNGNSGCNSFDANTLIKDTIPQVTNPNDSVTTVSVSDSAATIVIDTNFVGTLLCCNVISSFTVSDSIVCLGDTLYLYSTSTGADSVEWQINDSAFSASSNTSVNLNSTGTYTISLVASGNICEDTALKIVIVTDTVIANYDYSVSNLTVSFTDSSNFANDYYWNFGDGNTDTLQNPSHTYVDTGTYNVCLTVTNNCGSATLCKDVTISCKYPIAYFNYIDLDLTISFFDSSLFADSYYWIFGDGNSDTLQNPVHTYGSAGNYDVCLIVNNDCGPDAYCEIIIVDTISVGFHKLELEDAIRIYPNPSHNDLTVTINFAANKDIEIKIYNLLGDLIYNGSEESVTTKNFIIDLSDQPAGVYYFTINAGYNIVSKRFILIK